MFSIESTNLIPKFWNMNQQGKKRSREAKATGGSVSGEVHSEIQYVRRAKFEGSSRLHSPIQSGVTIAKKSHMRRRTGFPENVPAAGHHPSSLSTETEQLQPQARSGTTTQLQGGCPEQALAPASAWMHERVSKYVQRLPVLVSKPPSQVLSLEEDELLVYGTPNPDLFKLPIEWGPVPSTVRTTVTVCEGKRNIDVTLTREALVVDAWMLRQKGCMFGVDAEWKPQFKKNAPESKVAVLQISSASDCLIVQMLFLDHMPAGLVNFLRDPETKMAGVSVVGDFQRLNRGYGLSWNGEVELTSMAAAVFKNDEFLKMGLKKLAKAVINLDMEKPRRVTMSNWSKQVLDMSQVQYACIDAWISFAIFHTLEQRRLADSLRDQLGQATGAKVRARAVFNGRPPSTFTPKIVNSISHANKKRSTGPAPFRVHDNRYHLEDTWKRVRKELDLEGRKDVGWDAWDEHFV